MAAIETNRAAGNHAIQTGVMIPATNIPGKEPPNSPALPIAPYPQTPNPYQRTPLPAISTQQPDQQRQFQSGAVPQDRLIGIPLNANPVISAQTITNIVRVPSTIAGGILLETNNQPNAVQNVLNLIPGTNITMSSDAHGGVTITSTASGSTNTNFIPLPNSGLPFEARAIVGASALQTIGDASTQTQSAGTGANNNGTVPTATDGVNQQVTSGATNNSVFGFYPGNSKIFWAGRNNRYQARSRFPTAGDLSNARIWYGFTDQSPSNMRASAPAGANIAAFLFTGPNWTCVVANGGVYTTVGSGVAGDTNTHSFDIVMNDTSNTTTFYIDGVSVGFVSGSNPSGLGWFPTFVVGNTGAFTVNQNLEYFYASQDY